MYGVDGVLIGRAAEGNPQIFQGIDEPDYKQRLSWAVEHAYVYEQVFKPSSATDDDIRWFLPMRKHLAWYAHGFPGAVELRMSLMRTKNADEVRELIEKSLSN
jgi:tRNA-dihydrouridine synthase